MILCLFTCSVTILYPRSSLLETMKMVSNLSLESGVIRRGLIYLHLKGGGLIIDRSLVERGLLERRVYYRKRGYLREGLIRGTGLLERGGY